MGAEATGSFTLSFLMPLAVFAVFFRYLYLFFPVDGTVNAGSYFFFSFTFPQHPFLFFRYRHFSRRKIPIVLPEENIEVMTVFTRFYCF